MAKEKAKNWAVSEEFAKQFSVPLLAEFEELVSSRTEREQIWQESYASWSSDKSSVHNRNYKGRANLKAPLLRKEVETMSRRLMKGMFPEDYLSAAPDQMADHDLATANTQVMRHYYDNIMDLQGSLNPWVKQGVLYGTSPCRSFWRKDQNEVLYRKRFFEENEKTGEMESKFKTVQELVTLYDAPELQVCDMFQTYVYPTTAVKRSQVQRVYFQTKVDYNFLVEKYKAGTAINPEFLWDQGKEKDQEFVQTQERLQSFGDNGNLNAMHGNKLYDLIEVWGKAELGGKIIPYVCEIINKTHVIRIQQNPYWHQELPFYFFRFIRAPGCEFYGRGLPEASLPLGAMADDVLNQTMDSNSLRLNNVTIINPAFAPNADSFEVEPNAIWWADPAGVKQFEFPDLSDSGLKNFQALRSIITEMSDNQPQLPDPIAGKARSTGQAELAINEWNTDMYSFINQNILDALIPLTQHNHALLQQNVADDAIIQISGKYAGSWVNRVVTPEELVGRYNFRWNGAITVEDKRIKTQQLLQLFKIYPMLPPDSGVKLKIGNLMIKLLRDGFGIKDIENVMETPEFNATIPAHIENKVIAKGGTVKVNESDDDELHERSHTAAMNEEKDPYLRALYFQHINKHKEQRNKKVQAQQQALMMMQQMEMMNAQAPMANGTKRPGRPPQNPMNQPFAPNPMGNQTQLSESTDPADLQRGLS